MIPRALIIIRSLEVLVFIKRCMFTNNRAFFFKYPWVLDPVRLTHWNLWLQRKSEFKRSFNTSTSCLTVFIKRFVQILFCVCCKIFILISGQIMEEFNQSTCRLVSFTCKIRYISSSCSYLINRWVLWIAFWNNDRNFANSSPSVWNCECCTMVGWSRFISSRSNSFYLEW